jgi:hypothetical protein
MSTDTSSCLRGQGSSAVGSRDRHFTEIFGACSQTERLWHPSWSSSSI